MIWSNIAFAGHQEKFRGYRVPQNEDLYVLSTNKCSYLFQKFSLC